MQAKNTDMEKTAGASGERGMAALEAAQDAALSGEEKMAYRF